jgi:hypothetical protein
MTSGLTVGPVDNVTSNVQALALAGEAGQDAVPVGPNQVATFEDSNDSRQFLDVPIIHARHHQRSVSPAQRQAKIRNWSISVEPSHRSLKQEAIKSTVPVSQHATTTHLIRLLDLARPSEPSSEAAHKQYAALFQGPLTSKSIAAIRAATHLADALVSEELASQVEATTS